MEEETPFHAPVLVAEVLRALACQKNREAVYLDCTVGLGGHTEAILQATAPSGRVIGIDWDQEAVALAQKRLSSFRDRVALLRRSFQEIDKVAEEFHLAGVNGILFDLGVSSLQLLSSARGFSFQQPGPLDMRMDRRNPQTAADWVNQLPKEELAKLIRLYGEEKQSRRIAAAIVRYRESKGPITRTETLSHIVSQAVRQKQRPPHPATKTFQALRIAVNDECRELAVSLPLAISLLATGGRLVAISFHSLEDRSVKHCLRAASSTLPQEPWMRPEKGRTTPHETGKRFITLYKKVIVPTKEEVAHNPRARSAKLRALERVA